MTMILREPANADADAITTLLAAAFGPEEGQIIATLIARLLDHPLAAPRVSLVAGENERVVGYVLFTKVRLDSAEKEINASILAPLAVHPDFQQQGIGTRLVAAGLERLREQGCDMVFVLGHPGYYPRFGFNPAGARGLAAPYPIPERNADAWMVTSLRGELDTRVRGTVLCAPPLQDPMYWQE